MIFFGARRAIYCFCFMCLPFAFALGIGSSQFEHLQAGSEVLIFPFPFFGILFIGLIASALVLTSDGSDKTHHDDFSWLEVLSFGFWSTELKWRARKLSALMILRAVVLWYAGFWFDVVNVFHVKMLSGHAFYGPLLVAIVLAKLVLCIECGIATYYGFFRKNSLSTF